MAILKCKGILIKIPTGMRSLNTLNEQNTLRKHMHLGAVRRTLLCRGPRWTHVDPTPRNQLFQSIHDQLPPLDTTCNPSVVSPPLLCTCNYLALKICLPLSFC